MGYPLSRIALHRIALLATAAALAAACGAPATAETAPAKAATTVAVQQFQFQPARLEVSRGTTVTWTNRDAILHTATSGTARKVDELGTYERKKTGLFDGAMNDADTSFSFTFADAGEFTYFCDRHAHMTGTIVVK